MSHSSYLDSKVQFYTRLSDSLPSDTTISLYFVIQNSTKYRVCMGVSLNKFFKKLVLRILMLLETTATGVFVGSEMH